MDIRSEKMYFRQGLYGSGPYVFGFESIIDMGFVRQYIDLLSKKLFLKKKFKISVVCYLNVMHSFKNVKVNDVKSIFVFQLILI